MARVKKHPGETTCIRLDCGNVFQSPDVRSVRVCPECKDRERKNSNNRRCVGSGYWEVPRAPHPSFSTKKKG